MGKLTSVFQWPFSIATLNSQSVGRAIYPSAPGVKAPSSLVKRSKDPKLRQPIRNVKQAIRHFFRWGNVWNLGEFDHDLTVLTEIIGLFQRKHPLLWPNYSVSELL